MLALALCIIAQDVTVTSRETPTLTHPCKGVVVARDGDDYTVLTAAHVVRNCYEVRVGSLPAVVVTVRDDKWHDVAVLRVTSAEPLRVRPLSDRGPWPATLLSVETFRVSNALLEDGDSGAAVVQDGKVVGIVSGALSYDKSICWFTPADRIRELLK